MPRARRQRMLLDLLESRRLFTVVPVTGTAGPDEISISVTGGMVNINVNGAGSALPDASVTGIEIQSLGGDDKITILSNTDNPVTIIAGDGNDTITAAIADPNLSSPVFDVRGGAGEDRVSLTDPNNNFTDRWTVTAGLITRTFFAGLLYVDTEYVTVTAGPVLNRIDILSTTPGIVTRINGGGGDDDFRVLGTSSTPVLIDGQAGLDDVFVNDIDTGVSLARLVGDQDLDVVNVQGGELSMDDQQFHVAVMNSMEVNLTALFDVGVCAAIVDWTGFNPLANIRADIGNAYLGGTWNGRGVTSSVARTQMNAGVGYAESTQLFTNFPAVYAGVNIDDTAVIIRFALSGDSNLDGTVNIGDFARLAANFNQSPRDWFGGDYNYNDTTNIGDFSLLAGNFNQALPGRAAPVAPANAARDGEPAKLDRIAATVL